MPWRQIGAPAAVTLFGGVVFYALIVHLPYVITGLGVADAALIGLAAAIASLATAAGAISFRFLAKLGTRNLLALAFGLAAVVKRRISQVLVAERFRVPPGRR